MLVTASEIYLLLGWALTNLDLVVYMLARPAYTHLITTSAIVTTLNKKTDQILITEFIHPISFYKRMKWWIEVIIYTAQVERALNYLFNPPTIIHVNLELTKLWAY